MQRIRAHFLDSSVKISDHEKLKLERLTYLFSLRLKKRYSKEQALKKIREKYNISTATSYRDYQEMTLLFGDLDLVEQRVEVMFHRENYHFLYRKLKKEKKWEAAAKVYEKYVNTFPEIEEDEEYLELRTKKYIMKMDKALEKIVKEKLSSQPVIDLNKIDFQDVDYKKVDDAES